MTGSRTRGYLVLVVACVALTALAVWRGGELTLHNEVDVRLTLPDQVGPYEAEDVRFCHTESCLRSWRTDELTPEGRCPVCGGEVFEISLAERRLLPADTVIHRRRYVSPRGEIMDVSITVSGMEQKSLHRPQQCLPAQGQVIESSQVLAVPVPGRAPLGVMLLDLRPAGSAGGCSAYAYWFAGEGRETPYHWQRLWWMSKARVLHQQAYRWAYVAVATTRDPSSARHIERLRQFMAALYPSLAPPPAP
ncbi:MAG: EpsI family protein [Lentisphaerae bacterium]|nr:EpsI family protein [Lentisphaerota bacterium]